MRLLLHKEEANLPISPGCYKNPFEFYLPTMKFKNGPLVPNKSR